MNEFRPRLSEDWKGIIEQVKQLGPDRVKIMLEKAKEYQPEQIHRYKSRQEITQPGRMIVTGCEHFPFHNPAFHESKLALIEAVKPSVYIAAGDILDCFSVSSHNRGQWNMPGYTLKDEYDETNPRLDEVDSALPAGCKKVFIEGNHENRIARFQASVDNAKLGGALTDYIAGLRLLERGYEVLAPYKEAQLLIGDLLVIHGLYTSTHAAKAHLDRMGMSCLFFHTHRWQVYSDGVHTAYNCGWGGDVESPAFHYADPFSRQKWVNGLAVIELHENGKTTVTPLRYDDGFYFEGERY